MTMFLQITTGGTSFARNETMMLDDDMKQRCAALVPGVQIDGAWLDAETSRQGLHTSPHVTRVAEDHI